LGVEQISGCGSPRAARDHSRLRERLSEVQLLLADMNDGASRVPSPICVNHAMLRYIHACGATEAVVRRAQGRAGIAPRLAKPTSMRAGGRLQLSHAACMFSRDWTGAAPGRGS
jgi:hypothetical protein